MSTAFRVFLDSFQEVGTGSTSTATGLGTLVFDSTATTASYSLTITGLDFGELLNGGVPDTADPNDDVTQMHIHGGARGSNGAVAFDLLPLAASDDADDLTYSRNADGSWTISGKWETTDPANISLNTFAAALAAGVPPNDAALYFNIHTAQFGGGAIRGQFECIADDNANAINGLPSYNNEWLPGLGGNDTIDGRLGDDFLDGGAGNDRLIGGSGDDMLAGGPGNDTLDGIGGFDTADYRQATAAVTVNQRAIGAQNTIGAGIDTLIMIERVFGSAFNDTLTGNDSRLEGGPGDDRLTGGNFSDWASYAHAPGGVTVDLTIAGPQNTGSAGIDTLTSMDYLEGSAFADTLTAVSGSVRGGARGGAGNDTLRGVGGATAQRSDFVLEGDAGDDVIETNGFNSAGGGDGNDRITGGGDIYGGAGDDVLGGSGVLDYLTCDGSETPGRDIANGMGGDDLIFSRGGRDTIDGGAGDADLVSINVSHVRRAMTFVLTDVATAATVVGDGTSVVNCEIVSLELGDFGDAVRLLAGSGYIFGGGGQDTLEGGGELNGGAGDDTLRTRGDGSQAKGMAGDDRITGGVGNDRLYGDDTTPNIYTGRDTISGGAGDDWIHGGPDSDVIDGGSGNDYLNGSIGDDTLMGGGGVDRLYGNNFEFNDDGFDTASFADAAGAVIVSLGLSSQNVGGGLGTVTLYAIEGLIGGAFDDYLVGRSSDNWLSGLDGNDLLSGGDGADALRGAEGDDKLYGGRGDDLLDGGEGRDYADGDDGDDSITGGAARDFLNGQSGIDTIRGGDGDDRLTGGASLDYLFGDAGADDFAYGDVSESAPTGAGRDRINDFAAGIDDIDVSAIDARTSSQGNNVFSSFRGSGAFTGEAQVRWYQSGANTVIEFNTTGADGAEMQIQLQNFTAANLTAADFIA